MLSNIGFPTLILILVVALLLFGPNKLPELGRAFGRTLKEFKNGTKDILGDDDEPQAPRKVVEEEPVQQVRMTEATRPAAPDSRPEDAARDQNRRLPD